jgi:hypothetical protein
MATRHPTLFQKVYGVVLPETLHSARTIGRIRSAWVIMPTSRPSSATRICVSLPRITSRAYTPNVVGAGVHDVGRHYIASGVLAVQLINLVGLAWFDPLLKHGWDFDGRERNAFPFRNRSRLVTMPITRQRASTTGTPPIAWCVKRRAISSTLVIACTATTFTRQANRVGPIGSPYPRDTRRGRGLSLTHCE